MNVNIVFILFDDKLTFINHFNVILLNILLYCNGMCELSIYIQYLKYILLNQSEYNSILRVLWSKHVIIIFIVLYRLEYLKEYEKL